MVILKVKKINGKLNIIGKNLRKYRELRGLTQRELSEKLELLGLTIYGYFIKFSQAERLWEEIKYNKRLKI